MTYTLAQFAVHQTAKVIALVYGILGLILAPVFFFVSRSQPGGALPPWMIVVGPIVYAALAYVFTAVGLTIYNFIAGRTGGIEFTLSQTPQTP